MHTRRNYPVGDPDRFVYTLATAYYKKRGSKKHYALGDSDVIPSGDTPAQLLADLGMMRDFCLHPIITCKDKGCKECSMPTARQLSEECKKK